MRIKKAMILAAGLGTRLGEITQNKPKALVKVNGIPMLHRLLIKLRKEGIEEVMINLHHYGKQIIDSISENNDFNLQIRYSNESNKLLDTGGALVAAKEFFEEANPILIHNADILTNIDLQVMADFHLKMKAEATLFVSNRKSSRNLLFDDQHQLVGWTNHTTKTFKWVNNPIHNPHHFSFNGLWICQPQFIQQLPFSGRFSIIDAWLNMASRHSIISYKNDLVTWHDLGTKEKIAAAESYLKNQST